LKPKNKKNMKDLRLCLRTVLLCVAIMLISIAMHSSNYELVARKPTSLDVG